MAPPAPPWSALAFLRRPLLQEQPPVLPPQLNSTPQPQQHRVGAQHCCAPCPRDPPCLRSLFCPPYERRCSIPRSLRNSLRPHWPLSSATPQPLRSPDRPHSSESRSSPPTPPRAAPIAPRGPAASARVRSTEPASLSCLCFCFPKTCSRPQYHPGCYFWPQRHSASRSSNHHPPALAPR